MKRFKKPFFLVILLFFIVIFVSASAYAANKSNTCGRAFMPPRDTITSTFNGSEAVSMQGTAGDAMEIYLDYIRRYSGKSEDRVNLLGAIRANLRTGLIH
jgi:hypothetical protein